MQIGEKGFGYKGSPIHRIDKEYVQHGAMMTTQFRYSRWRYSEWKWNRSKVYLWLSVRG